MSQADTSLSTSNEKIPLVKPALITAEDLLKMPRGEVRRELLNGELFTMTPASFEHGDVALELGARIRIFVRDRDLGRAFGAETGFLLTSRPDTVRAPDVSFVKKDRLGIAAGRKGFWPGAPDLAVEVISPGDSYAEVLAKTNQWLEHGCQQVWLVDPRARQVAIHRTGNLVELFSDGQTLAAHDLLPGFEVKVADLFQPIA